MFSGKLSKKVFCILIECNLASVTIDEGNSVISISTKTIFCKFIKLLIWSGITVIGCAFKSSDSNINSLTLLIIGQPIEIHSKYSSNLNA